MRRYRILRGVDDPNYVMIDLEFDGVSEAETFLVGLKSCGAASMYARPKALLVEIVESKES